MGCGLAAFDTDDTHESVSLAGECRVLISNVRTDDCTVHAGKPAASPVICHVLVLEANKRTFLHLDGMFGGASA